MVQVLFVKQLSSMNYLLNFFQKDSFGDKMMHNGVPETLTG